MDIVAKELTPEIDCDQTAMALPPVSVTSSVFFIAFDI
jgi:hypothetical protein